jgi:hypothetical protein
MILGKTADPEKGGRLEKLFQKKSSDLTADPKREQQAGEDIANIFN